MEYLVEVEEDYPISRFFNKPEKVSRLIYEVDEDSAESRLMTATLDHVFIQGTQGNKRGSCRE